MVCVSQQAADVTSANISLCLLLTYFTCNHGDDVTPVSGDAVTRQPLSLWQQRVMRFVDKLLLSNRRDSRHLRQTFALISRLLKLNISTGMSLCRVIIICG